MQSSEPVGDLTERPDFDERRWVVVGKGPNGCVMMALEGAKASIPASFVREFRDRLSRPARAPRVHRTVCDCMWCKR